MPSTPSKTNCQANYFGSKVVPTEFDYNLVKKAPIWQKKIRLFARYAKSPLIFTYIVRSVSVFGLRPDVFPARYSVRPKVKNIPSVIHCGQQHHIWNMFGIYISFLFSTPENLSQFSIVPLKCCAWKNWKK